ncbi:MAG TPA: hypothetical protein VFV83_11470 [Chthoniobacteraceae bacterium]|nr:hypothetical protein [Chthoniobacteraceae bacterium]
MEEETFFAKIVHLAVFIAICVAILVIGWREPLSYRFMSPEEISDRTTPPVEPPRPTPVPPPSRLEQRPARGMH